MAFTKRTAALTTLSVLILGLAGWFSNWASPGGEDYVNAIRKNISLFGLVYRKLSQNYVEQIDPDKLMHTGIDAMLEALDPYTVLIEDEDNEQLQIMTTGKYGGLGMLIGLREGFPTVVEPPYEGTPALRAGIREGDQIIAIDGESTKGKSVNEVATKLRGEVGTAIQITIAREGEEEPIDFRLIRAEIVIKDVDYAGMIEDGIGYIKLTRFSKNAGREVQTAISSLREQGLKGLILDLRNNPGGLLDAAVSVCEAVLPKGQLIVSTKGRVEGSAQAYYSEQEPVLGGLPLVLLVNEGSASASEIVAGAVQDDDRGLLVGRPTFGKGLVQSVIGLTRDSQLKLTTAKYYLPSGRLIQKERRPADAPDVLVASAAGPHMAPRATDPMEHPAFKTAGGRQVYGGGGLIPDVRVESDTLNRYQISLLRKTMVFNYAVLYANTHENLKRGFAVTDEIVEDFRRFLQEKNFDFTPRSEELLQDLDRALEQDQLMKEVSPSISTLKNVIQRKKERAFDENLEFIREQLAMEISAKLWGTQAKLEVTFAKDKDLREAITLLKSPERYQKLLVAEQMAKAPKQK